MRDWKMKRSRSLLRLASSGFAALAVALFLTGADDAKQTIDAKGLKFEAPPSWKSTPPSRGMRAAVLKAQPMEGDDYPAELVVFVFADGVGSVQANIDRWKQQFTDKDGNPAQIEDKKVKGKNVDVIRVETAGHYHPPRFPGLTPEPEREGARLLGGIVVTGKATYVIKMIGPDKTMAKLRPDFDALLATAQVKE
jgi:hypothetical protein